MIADWGLYSQMFGFILLLFYKKNESLMAYNDGSKAIKCILGDTVDNFAEKHPRISVNCLPFGVILIISGLILQLSEINHLVWNNFPKI